MDKDEMIAHLQRENQQLKTILKQLGYSDHITSYTLDRQEKINIFYDYFAGRKDVYAKKFYNKKKQRYAYCPACANEFQDGICAKKGLLDGSVKRVNCGTCTYQKLLPYNCEVLENHLKKSGKAIGIYPLHRDNTCSFLAIDFDDDDWFFEMLSVRNVAKQFHYPSVMERSASGNGGHLWFFFRTPLKASKARRFGDFLISEAMKQNCKMTFRAFDRMFPNQDTVSEDGFGNLIALPYQHDYAKKHTTVFIDEEGNQILQPMEYLAGTKKIEEEEIDRLVQGDVLKDFFFEGDQARMQLDEMEKYSPLIEGTISSMLCIRTDNLNTKTMLALKRLASMPNPEYYEKQRLHKLIDLEKTPKIRSEYMTSQDRLYLPRGIIEKLPNIFVDSVLDLKDDTEKGHAIAVEFKEGEQLREEQKPIVASLLKNSMGLLVANTAYGKTVMALYVIAQRKVSTLVIVNTKELLQQWQQRMEDFLDFPKAKLKRDYYIGNYHGSKKQLKGNLDIATIQSLANSDNLSELLHPYGMVIIDECHHAASNSFIKVLREVRSHYIYGLTATPQRRDRLDKVMYMYCGPKLYETSNTQALMQRKFKQVLVPRYTTISLLKDTNILTSICNELAENNVRNYMISVDILTELRKNKTILVLSERVKHLEVLYEKVRDSGAFLYLLTGKTKASDRKEILRSLQQHIDSKQNFVLFSTSTLVGEGFDIPAFDTLFLTLPFSGKNRVSQYAGRLHRNYEGKDCVRIFDYVDIHVPYLEGMYQKRLKQLSKEGYQIEMEHTVSNLEQTVFEGSAGIQAIWKDIENATKSLVIMNDTISLTALKKHHDTLLKKAHKGVSIRVYTRDNKKSFASVRDYLKGAGAKICIMDVQQCYVIIDQQIVWLCSDNLFVQKKNASLSEFIRLEDGMLAEPLLTMYQHAVEKEGLFAL